MVFMIDSLTVMVLCLIVWYWC